MSCPPHPGAGPDRNGTHTMDNRSAQDIIMGQAAIRFMAGIGTGIVPPPPAVAAAPAVVVAPEWGCDGSGCHSGLCSPARGKRERLALRTYYADATGIPAPMAVCHGCGTMVDYRLPVNAQREDHYAFYVRNGVTVLGGENGHVLPMTDGGRYCLRNIVPTCRPCNVATAHRPMAVLPAFRPAVRTVAQRAAVADYRAAVDAAGAAPVHTWGVTTRLRNPDGTFRKSRVLPA